MVIIFSLAQHILTVSDQPTDIFRIKSLSWWLYKQLPLVWDSGVHDRSRGRTTTSNLRVFSPAPSYFTYCVTGNPMIRLGVDRNESFRAVFNQEKMWLAETSKPWNKFALYIYFLGGIGFSWHQLNNDPLVSWTFPLWKLIEAQIIKNATRFIFWTRRIVSVFTGAASSY